MNLKTCLSALLFTFTVSLSSFAQTPGVKCEETVFIDPLLENLTGRWTAGGTIQSDAVNYMIEGSWVLNHQFFELYFRDIQKQPEYMAHVYIGYDCMEERYVIHWLDNYGGRPSQTLGYGSRNGDNLELRFSYPDGPFKNVFTYNRSADTWTFHSTSKNKKGEWHDFGKLELTKAK